MSSHTHAPPPAPPPLSPRPHLNQARDPMLTYYGVARSDALKEELKTYIDQKWKAPLIYAVW